MSRYFLPRLPRFALTSLLTFVVCVPSSLAQTRRHNHGKIFAGYFEEWGINYAGYNIADLQRNGVADELTHLIYAFGNVTPASPPACTIADPVAAYQNPNLPSVNGKPYTAPLYGNFGAIRQLKELHPNLKVLISLGGQAGDVTGFITAAASPTGRAALASSCINLFVKGNIAAGVTAPGLFDGFNLDWEFPGPADKRNFTALLKEFRTQLNALSKTTGRKYVLTFDSPNTPKKYANIDLKAAAAQVDFLTIDGYDYASPDEKQTNESSSLYDTNADPLYADLRFIDATVRAYLKEGVPADKYTMGLPLYAVGWTGVPNVPERDRAISGSVDRWIGSMREARQSESFARLRHHSDRRVRDLLHYRKSSTARWLYRLVRFHQSRGYALQSGKRNLLHLRQSWYSRREDGLYQGAQTRRGICLGAERRRCPRIAHESNCRRLEVNLLPWVGLTREDWAGGWAKVPFKSPTRGSGGGPLESNYGAGRIALSCASNLLIRSPCFRYCSRLHGSSPC
jgi:GH18 family chitinase